VKGVNSHSHTNSVTDCGPIGWECCNKDCTYDQDIYIRWLRKDKERKERAELARLKEKYEG
jgi:hypothetical protein